MIIAHGTVTLYKNNTPEHYSHHQQGIALVMVLGILSVMVIMAVGFAIAMRTERVAAGNFLDNVKATQLVRSSLALAMADLHQRLYVVERESCTADLANSLITVSNAYDNYPSGIQLAFNNMGYFATIPHQSALYSISRSANTISIASNYSDAMTKHQIDLSGYGADQIGNIIKRMRCEKELCGFSGNELIVSKYYKTTTQVALSTTANTLPLPLLPGKDYFVINPTTGTVIKVALSHEDYEATNAIDITSSGTGINEIESYTFTADPASDLINVNGFRFLPGTPVQFFITSAAGGHLPSPLTDNQCYFVINVSTTRIKLANSFENAVLGNNINIGGSGSGTHSINLIGYPYPPWAAVASYSTNRASLPFSLTNNALNYIPASLTSAVSAVDAACKSNYWINLESVVNGQTTTVGRVAYLVVNCSGLLDANYAGGSARSGGTNPAEIAIEYLDEIAGAKADFLNYRTAKGPFETLPALANWKTNSWHPANMFCFSHCFKNSWNNNLLDVEPGKVNLALSAAELERGDSKNDIIAAFSSLGLTPTEAGTVYTNLVDYVDEDSIPRDLHASIEAVPMINEVVFKNSVTVSSTNYYLVGSLTVELWYPFANPNPASFDFELQLNITCDYINFTLPTINFSTNVTCTPNSFQTLTITSTNSMSWDASKVPPDPAPPPQVIWQNTITNVAVKYAGKIVDRIDTSISCTTTTKTTVSYDSSQMSKECVDPRFNWDPDSDQWSPWLINALSIGVVNSFTTNYWATMLPNDSNAPLYIANKPLQSLTELNHLIYSARPWTTMGTFTRDYDSVFELRWFDSGRGYVNPNTTNREVLAATFYDVQAGASKTTQTDAQIIADEIINGRGLGYKTITEVIKTIMDSTTIRASIDKNALISNTSELLNLRQNLFVIIIEAQVASGGNIPRNPAKQKAIAVVWRDPFRDQFFVRSLIFF